MNRSTEITAFLTSAARDLGICVNSHARWLGSFHQAMICGGAANPSIIGRNAERLCAFGRWFRNKAGAENWMPWKGDLDSVDALHRALHESARTMIEHRAAGNPIDGKEYTAFAESAMRFDMALRALQARLLDSVCLVDPLTGVWNRNSMQQKLAEEYSRMVRCGQPSVLCMMDLDHFKAVNDTYGHLVGDKVLQSATELAKKRLRTYDSIFRYGGEEFLFCLPNIAPDVATNAMDRIRADLAQHRITVTDGRQIRVTASFGVTSFQPDLSLDENIDFADRALYQAKTAGRNRVCRWR